MVKKLNELDVRITGDVVLRLKKSKAFLNGESEELDLGGKNLISIWSCRIMKWLGAITLIGLIGMAFYIWMWDSSPLTTKVDARITKIAKTSQGGNIDFEYEVNDKTYKSTQYANSLRKRWKDDPGTGEVVYLNFMPGKAKLKTTIERMDWSMLFIGPILPLGFLIGGIWGLRSAQRLSRIEDNATHLIEGVIDRRVPIKGMALVQYKAISPTNSGTEIFGSVNVGKLESILKDLQVGTPVAVVYAGDKEHTLL